MYEFWCGVILRDVRSAILTTHQNEYIYFHNKPNSLFIIYALQSLADSGGGHLAPLPPNGRGPMIVLISFIDLRAPAHFLRK